MNNILDLILPAIPETLYMVFLSALVSVIFGIFLGVILATTRNDGLSPNKIIYTILDWTVNIFRSLPFVILMMLIFPITRIIVGKIYGTTAAIVPLTISAAPFVARLIEANLMEVDKGIVEAAKAMGSTKFQIITRVLIKEAMPSILSSITVTVINIISYSAMAGLLGGGGLGDIANRYGYLQRKYDILIISVICIIAFVQIVQAFGNYCVKKIDRR